MPDGERASTPWVAEGLTIHTVDSDPISMRAIARVLSGPESFGSSLIESRLNAAFIVKACNSHDALVAALQKAIGELDPEMSGYRIVELREHLLKVASFINAKPVKGA